MNINPELHFDLGRCEACAVRQQAVCGALSETELIRLNQIGRRRIVPAGQTIMSSDEPAAFFATVITGVIKLTRTMTDGRQQIVGLLFPPDFLGRAYSDRNRYDAEAATEVDICCFPRHAFEALLKEFPGLEHRLFQRTLDELDSAREWMLLLGRKTAEEKVSSFLQLLLQHAVSSGCRHVPAAATPIVQLPVTRADMADFLGLTIETVSRQFTRLKTRGIIRLEDQTHFTVPDPASLAQLAGQDG